MADESDKEFNDDQGGSPAPGQQSDGMAGQPIGGNDSATGTGTTLTQGADFDAQAEAGSNGNETRTNYDTGLGQGTTSNAGGSAVGTDQTSGGPSGVSGGEGFVGSHGDNSSEYLQQDGADGGSDFAKQGRAAVDEEDGESGGGKD
jgi:hypothetical protein